MLESFPQTSSLVCCALDHILALKIKNFCDAMHCVALVFRCSRFNLIVSFPLEKTLFDLGNYDMQNMIKPTLYLSVLVGLVGCGSTVTGATGSNDATIAPIGVITSTAISTALVADASVTDLDNDGIVDAEDIDSDGDGLIEISTLEQLDWMRNDLQGTSLIDNEGNVANLGCFGGACEGYELVANLDFDTNGDGMMDANDDFFDTDADGEGNGWLPVGNDVAPFKANFNGNGFSISNLFVARDTSDLETAGSRIGLFGQVSGSDSAPITIQNVILDGDLMSLTGEESVGGLVGLASRVDINDSAASGSVTGVQTVGGLVGNASSVAITNSSAASVVTGETAVGGLVGFAPSGAILNSSATGAVMGDELVGGLVGFANSTVITDSSATGAVTGDFSIGGLVGNASGTITNSFATGTVTGAETVGGLVGFASSADISFSFAANNVSGAVSAGAFVGETNMATYEENHFASDISSLDAVGLAGIESINVETDITGDTLAYLLAVTASIGALSDDSSADI